MVNKNKKTALNCFALVLLVYPGVTSSCESIKKWILYSVSTLHFSSLIRLTDKPQPNLALEKTLESVSVAHSDFENFEGLNEKKMSYAEQKIEHAKKQIAAKTHRKQALLKWYERERARSRRVRFQRKNLTKVTWNEAELKKIKEISWQEKEARFKQEYKPYTFFCCRIFGKKDNKA